MASMDAFGAGDPQKRKPLPGEPGYEQGGGPGGGAQPADAFGAGGISPIAPVGDPPRPNNGVMTPVDTVGDPQRPNNGVTLPGAGMTPQDANAAGLGWVDQYNPNYGKPGFVGSTPAPTAPPAPGVTGDPQRPNNGVLLPATPGPTETTTTAPAPYKDALMKMLGDAQTPASLNDPALKAQSDAAAVGLTRGSEAARAQAAERLAAQGLSSSGAADAEYGGIAERQGEQQAGINAGLVGDAARQKLQSLQSALSMMGADINSAEGRALQQQIAETQAQIQREGMKQSGSQFDRQLAQQGSQFGTDADLRRLGITSQTDLGNRDLSLRDKLGTGGLNAEIMRLLMNDKQFGQNLGAQTGMYTAGLNQNALLQLLGGL